MQDDRSLAETQQQNLGQTETKPMPVSSDQPASGPSIPGYLCRSILAVLLAWCLIQSLHPVFEVPAKYNIGMGSPPEATEAFRVQQVRAAKLNSMLEVAIFGGLVAGAIALGKSACCPIYFRLPAAIPWGALTGTVAGLVASLVLASRNAATLPDVSDTMKVQAVLFACLGAGLGLMAGVFARSKRSGLTGTVAGAIAGVIAGIAYPIMAAIALPTVSVERVVPDGTTIQLLWGAIFAGCFSLIVPLALKTKPAVSDAVASNAKANPTK